MYMLPLRNKADKQLDDLIKCSIKQIHVSSSWGFGTIGTDSGFYASGEFGGKRLVIDRAPTSDEYYIGFPFVGDEQKHGFSLRSLESIDGVDNLVNEMFELVGKMTGNDIKVKI